LKEGVPEMNPHLMTLLEIQDLRSKIRELRDEGGALETLEQEHFNIDPGEAVGQLRERIGLLEDELVGPVRRRYGRVKDSLDRVVVPVINGVCYGCFVSIATAVAGEIDPNLEVQTCENCWRFLYILS
jgi:predicted  nucleic acid-binding Zn-ribbon protein